MYLESRLKSTTTQFSGTVLPPAAAPSAIGSRRSGGAIDLVTTLKSRNTSRNLSASSRRRGRNAVAASHVDDDVGLDPVSPPAAS